MALRCGLSPRLSYRRAAWPRHGIQAADSRRMRLYRPVHAAIAAAVLSHSSHPLARHGRCIEDRAALPHRLPDRGVEYDGRGLDDEAAAHPSGALIGCLRVEDLPLRRVSLRSAA